MKASEARLKTMAPPAYLKLKEVIRYIEGFAKQGMHSCQIELNDDLKNELRKLGYKVEDYDIDGTEVGSNFDKVSW